jgi:hypothetical protein
MSFQPTSTVALMTLLIKTCFAAASLAFAAGVSAVPTIELKDGSRIQGEVQSIENGVYTIRSSSIGTVHVNQSNIARIVYSGDVPAAKSSTDKTPARNEALSQDVQQLEANLAKDPATMQAIMSLQSDPQIQAVMNDPAIAKAIQEGDYTSLLANPKIQALENDEHLKQIVQQQAH